MAEHTFRWPKGPQEVIITGDFDKWSGSLPLVKSPQGDFAITMPIAQTSNDRFAFKFIVDGEWRTSNEYQTTVQPDGIVNNFVVISSLASAREATSKSSSAGGRIPEIGLNLVAPEVAAPVLGTQAPQKAQPAPRSNKKNKKKKIQIKRRIRRNKKTGERTILSEERSELKSGSEDETYETEETATATGTSREETPLSVDLGSTDAQQQPQPSTDFSSTVMPSSENKQTTLGEPGIAIVPNAANIKEFSEIRDVDADELNERLNRELAEKQKAETPIEKQNEKSAPVLATSETEKPVSEKPVSEKPVSEKDVSAPEFPVVAKNISPPEFPVTEKETLPTKNTVEEKDAASTKVLVEGEQVSAPETPVLQKKATEPESSIPEKKIAPAVLPTSEKNLAGDETAISAPESSSAAKESGSAALATSGIALASAGVPIEKSIKSSGLIEEDVPSPRLSAESDVGAATENLSISTPLKKNVDTESAPEVLPVPQTFDQGILDPARSQPVAKDSSGFASASAADAAATAAASKAVADAATEDTIASPKVDLSSEAKSDVPATGTKVVSEDIPLTEPVHTPEASAPVIDTVESPKDKNLAPVPLFEDPSVAQAGATDPAATTKSSATEEHVSKPLVTKEVSETAVVPPAELSSEQRSVGSRPDDVDIVIVEGELNELPPQFSPTTATSKSVPEASQDEPADVIRGVPDSTDLVPKESGDAFEESAVSQKSGPIVTEEIGVITSPEQEAELIRKTLDPKASSPGEIEELLIVEGNIPPSQVAEYQAASEAAAAKVIASQKPEEVVVQQDANPKESSKPAPAKNSTTKQKPASPPATKSTEKDKKKKKGLFSKIKKIFH